jgi:hypothetical protein
VSLADGRSIAFVFLRLYYAAHRHTERMGIEGLAAIVQAATVELRSSSSPSNSQVLDSAIRRKALLRNTGQRIEAVSFMPAIRVRLMSSYRAPVRAASKDKAWLRRDDDRDASRLAPFVMPRTAFSESWQPQNSQCARAAVKIVGFCEFAEYVIF